MATDPANDPRRRLGARGEQLAQAHLSRAGYELIECNFRCRVGELDIVASDDRALVFCEVKTRVAGSRFGPVGPLEAIGPAKQRRLRMLAREWLHQSSDRARPALALVRFDAIGITVDTRGMLVSLEHVENAF